MVENLSKLLQLDYDPREVLGRSVTTVESPHAPFAETESLSYPEREAYTGERLEGDLSRLILEPLGQQTLRALLRFSNRDDLLFCQYGMGAKIGEKWFINHPFDTIDGIEEAESYPTRRGASLHLDIFSRRSIPNLGKVINLEDEKTFVTDKELLTLVRVTLKGRGVEFA